MKTISSQPKGFTLVEMMVSVSIFAIVAVVAVGALLKIVDANEKAQSLETSINNLNFVLDSITREMRVGTTYHCSSGKMTSGNISPAGCPAGYSGQWTIAFKSSERNKSSTCNLTIAYHYDGAQILKAQQPQTSDECEESLEFYPLISNEAALDSHVTFQAARVIVDTGRADAQPYAQFHFRGFAGTKERNKSTFDLQTTISQRLPD